jgi:hypothetical protein
MAEREKGMDRVVLYRRFPSPPVGQAPPARISVVDYRSQPAQRGVLWILSCGLRSFNRSTENWRNLCDSLPDLKRIVERRLILLMRGGEVVLPGMGAPQIEIDR